MTSNVQNWATLEVKGTRYFLGQANVDVRVHLSPPIDDFDRTRHLRWEWMEGTKRGGSQLAFVSEYEPGIFEIRQAAAFGITMGLRPDRSYVQQAIKAYRVDDKSMLTALVQVTMRQLLWQAVDTGRPMPSRHELIDWLRNTLKLSYQADRARNYVQDQLKNG